MVLANKGADGPMLCEAFESSVQFIDGGLERGSFFLPIGTIDLAGGFHSVSNRTNSLDASFGERRARRRCFQFFA